MKRKTKQKTYWELTTEELAEATREFDREFIADTLKPMTPEMRARWEQLKRNPGRPKNGNGAQVISVSVERSLLAESDALARKMKLTRAALIARGLRTMLVAEGVRS